MLLIDDNVRSKNRECDGVIKCLVVAKSMIAEDEKESEVKKKNIKNMCGRGLSGGFTN